MIETVVERDLVEIGEPAVEARIAMLQTQREPEKATDALPGLATPVLSPL